MAFDLLSPSDYVRLDWSKQGETVTVIPQNETRFEIKKRKLIDFLKLAKESDQFEQQLNLLLEVLAQWLSTHSGKVRGAYLTMDDGSLVFVAVQLDVQYDEKFDDELAELDYSIANDPDLNLIRLRALSLPPVEGSALEQFFNRNFLLVYSGGN